MTDRYDGRPVAVAGAGVAGAAAARFLRSLGAQVTVLDADEGRRSVMAEEGFAVADRLPEVVDQVVTSPGWRPTAEPLVEAAARGIEVIGEVELAWRRRSPGAAPWLALTGTNGKTTTVRMLESILGAAGHRTVAVGNVGLPLLDVVNGDYDVLAVELSSFQLHWAPSVRPHTGAILNIADDHTDWHGSFQDYVLAKARLFDASTCVGNADDEVVRTLLSRARGRGVAFTLQAPRSGELGVVEHLLVDRAFPGVPGEATAVAELADIPVHGDHNVANALAATAMARSFGVPAEAVASGLRAFRPEPHRNALVATVGSVAWVDDSKATNPHAAAASLAAYRPVVWVAGGLLKGADVDDLVRGAADRLRGVVLLGTDRASFREALARHAPDVPVAEVARLDTGAMHEAVRSARAFAQPGDTVLLAPAAASMDCFTDYKQRGDLFTAEVRALR